MDKAGGTIRHMWDVGSSTGPLTWFQVGGDGWGKGVEGSHPDLRGLRNPTTKCTQRPLLDLSKVTVLKKVWDIPGATVDKKICHNAGNMGLMPGQEDSTCFGITMPMCHN